MAVESPNLSALAAYAGVYEQKLFSTLFNSLDAAKDMTLYENVKGKIQMTKLTAGNGARPFSSTFEGKGTDLIYTPQTLTVTEGKRDLLIDPSLYRSTWMAAQMQAGHNPQDIPFAGYVWNEVMVELAAEINNRTVYFGFDRTDATIAHAWDVGTASVAGQYYSFVNTNGIMDWWLCITNAAAAQSPITNPAKFQMANAEAICKGLAKVIADGITATNITVDAIGALATNTAYAQALNLFRAMPVAYQKSGVCMYLSYSNYQMIVDNYQATISKFTTVDTDIMYLPGTSNKCVLVPATWMGNSGRLICTPKANLLLGTDRLSDLNKINTFPQLYTLQAGIVFSLGTQIRDLSAIVVSDIV